MHLPAREEARDSLRKSRKNMLAKKVAEFFIKL